MLCAKEHKENMERVCVCVCARVCVCVGGVGGFQACVVRGRGSGMTQRCIEGVRCGVVSVESVGCGLCAMGLGGGGAAGAAGQ